MKKLKLKLKLKLIIFALLLLPVVSFAYVSIYSGAEVEKAVREGLSAESRLELTVDTSITETQLLGSRFITNQGDANETDLTLPAVSYGITRIFVIEEEQNIEINPPSGEAFDLDGNTLDADDCVDSDSTVGSKIAITRMKNAAGTWIWSLDTIRGVWTDTGPSD